MRLNFSIHITVVVSWSNWGHRHTLSDSSSSSIGVFFLRHVTESVIKLLCQTTRTWENNTFDLDSFNVSKPHVKHVYFMLVGCSTSVVIHFMAGVFR